MTAIIAIEHDGKVWMGADSAGSRDWDLRLRSEDDSKIIERDGWLIGISGTSRWLSLLKAKFVPPSLQPAPITLDQKRGYVEEVVESMYQLAKEYDLIGDDKVIDAAALIGFQGTLWVVDTGFGLIRHTYPFAAIGCGDQVALGALYAYIETHKELMSNPEISAPMVTSIIMLALKAAEEFSVGVRGPFVITEV